MGAALNTKTLEGSSTARRVCHALWIITTPRKYSLLHHRGMNLGIDTQHLLCKVLWEVRACWHEPLLLDVMSKGTEEKTA